MERIQFSIDINAPKKEVWLTLWDDDTYCKWTAPFCEGSHAVSDWQQGSKVLFLNGTGEGMVSTIVEKKPFEVMVFEHIGMVKNGVEDTESESVKGWAGAKEMYTLTEQNGVTTLTIEQDITPTEKAYFEEVWPKALQQVKTLAENP